MMHREIIQTRQTNSRFRLQWQKELQDEPVQLIGSQHILNKLNTILTLRNHKTLYFSLLEMLILTQFLFNFVSDIRLVNGSSNSSGRVEFLLNGAWGSICANQLTGTAAAVICRTLGYNVTGWVHCIKVVWYKIRMLVMSQKHGLQL